MTAEQERNGFIDYLGLGVTVGKWTDVFNTLIAIVWVPFRVKNISDKKKFIFLPFLKTNFRLNILVDIKKWIT